MLKKILIGLSLLAGMGVAFLYLIASDLLDRYDYVENMDTTNSEIYMKAIEENKMIATKDKIPTKEDVANVLSRDVFVFIMKRTDERSQVFAIGTKEYLQDMFKNGEIKKIEQNSFEMELKNDVKNISEEEYNKIYNDICTTGCYIVSTDEKNLLIVHD